MLKYITEEKKKQAQNHTVLHANSVVNRILAHGSRFDTRNRAGRYENLNSDLNIYYDMHYV